LSGSSRTTKPITTNTGVTAGWPELRRLNGAAYPHHQSQNLSHIPGGNIAKPYFRPRLPPELEFDSSLRLLARVALSRKGAEFRQAPNARTRGKNRSKISPLTPTSRRVAPECISSLMEKPERANSHTNLGQAKKGHCGGHRCLVEALCNANLGPRIMCMPYAARKWHLRPKSSKWLRPAAR